MVTLMGQRQMADRAEAVLAVLSSARAEVLWWFQHWEEVTYYSFAKAQLSACCHQINRMYKGIAFSVPP